MTVQVEFGSKNVADSYRTDHTEHLSDHDDGRLKTVTFTDDTPDWLIDRAAADAQASRAEQTTAAGGRANLTDAEQASLKRQHRTWNWQAHGFEAMRVKGALQAEGATDWMDFYEPNEGVQGALANLRASKGRAARTGATTGLGGEPRDRDPDDPTVQAERARSAVKAAVEECDHAERVCRNGDPEACEFLGEACGFEEAEIDRIMGGEGDPVAMAETPFSAPQLGALRRAWGGYYGAVEEIASALDTIQAAEEHATEAFEAINAIRADAGQDPIQPHRLEELRTTELSELCERPDRDPTQFV